MANKNARIIFIAQDKRRFTIDENSMLSPQQLTMSCYDDIDEDDEGEDFFLSI